MSNNIYDISLCGKRPTNEDEHLIINDVHIKYKEINNDIIKSSNIYAVFDGHGGDEVSHYILNF